MKGLGSSSIFFVDYLFAGGMHTVVLDSEGSVWTFGCNDEGSLGRKVDEEEECFTPGNVEIDEKIVQISAGDSHSAALTESGQVGSKLILFPLISKYVFTTSISLGLDLGNI